MLVMCVSKKLTSGFCISCCTMGLSRICRTDSGLLPISRIIFLCISCKLLAPPPGAPKAVMPLNPLSPASDPKGFGPDRPSEPKGLAAASLPAGGAPGEGADVEPAEGDAGFPVAEVAGEAGYKRMT